MRKREPFSPTSLPKGIRDYLPDMAVRMRRVEGALSRVFELWGYRKVITPIIEYLDVLALAEPGLLERMFKFEDRVSGKVLALRPDITAQIARLTATHLKLHPKPLRLSYSGTILHYGESSNDSQRVDYQTGLELIGLDLPEADGEVIAISIEALKSTGLTDFKIDVGQVEFFRGVMESLNLLPDQRKEIDSIVARKDRSGLEELLKTLNLNSADEETLLSLPTLFGGRDVLDRADTLKVSGKAKKALENLSGVLDVVESYGLMDYITIDLGEIRDLHYYTGIIFEGFAAGTGESICGGGRYDALLSNYGYDTPATGFAINVETIIKALENQGKMDSGATTDYLLVNCKQDKRDALTIAKYCRSRGISVARDIVKRDMDESKSFAESENIKGLLIVGGESVSNDEITVYNVDSEEKTVHKINDLLDGKVDL
ncbi:MAG: ATP phosphoribosyltransferase regulatory subunit [Proteobacteria bacterium]|nr:ATP phosphoribosyltransferase regulatory subunit [Pseudomonadota bacterium]